MSVPLEYLRAEVIWGKTIIGIFRVLPEVIAADLRHQVEEDNITKKKGKICIHPLQEEVQGNNTHMRANATIWWVDNIRMEPTASQIGIRLHQVPVACQNIRITIEKTIEQNRGINFIEDLSTVKIWIPRPA